MDANGKAHDGSSEIKVGGDDETEFRAGVTRAFEQFERAQQDFFSAVDVFLEYPRDVTRFLSLRARRAGGPQLSRAAPPGLSPRRRPAPTHARRDVGQLCHVG